MSDAAPTGSAPHSGRFAHQRPPIPPAAALPNPVKYYWGGVAVIGSIFGGFWIFLNYKQNQRLLLEPLHPEKIPAWEHRLKQASIVEAPKAKDSKT
ncbi:hypothetical protein DENSPDRAFT_838848 [Dentipellis sp. KUC8613]|nr:hypothetical protein DENSPDRAFT_838848 [Dentipellis sp. KUC8613]